MSHVLGKNCRWCQQIIDYGHEVRGGVECEGGCEYFIHTHCLERMVYELRSTEHFDNLYQMTFYSEYCFCYIRRYIKEHVRVDKRNIG